MSGKLILVPSLKFKKKRRPSRTQSQMAPLASYDEFQLSDVSDNEEAISHSKSTPDSAPLPRLKHHYSTDDADLGHRDMFKYECRNSVPSNEYELQEENHQEYSVDDDTVEADQLEMEKIKEEVEELIDETVAEFERFENVKVLKDERDEENDDVKENDTQYDEEDYGCDDDIQEGEEVILEENDNENAAENETMEIYTDGSYLERATPSDNSGVATEPNTPNDYNQSMEECSERGEEVREDGYQKEEYYQYEEEPAVDAGDDPFSIDYQQSRRNDPIPTNDNKDPPQIVITEPSDSDLPSIDASKPTKPSRPPELSKTANIPKRPPPPVAYKKTETELRKIPPPPQSSKRRNKQSDQDVDLSKKTKFPFKSHFEKKPLVPNPKKAILNVLKGESKKERKRRKAEEEFDKILNAVDPEDAPICESTDEWKAYKEFQERISASVQKTQENIKNLVGDESEISEETYEKDDGDKENKNWTDFEVKDVKSIERFEDLESVLMSAVNQHKLDDVDIWGAEESLITDKPVIDFNLDFDLAQVTFEQTFNKTIEDTIDESEEEDLSNAQFMANDNTNEAVEETIFTDSFEIEMTKELEVDKALNPETDVPEEGTRRRPKPQRQETLSGNNPFRKASLAEENKSGNESPEDESPFMAALKAAGVMNLEESSQSFDPLTTIYPDSGDEKEVQIENDEPSHSSDSNDESFQQFKIKGVVKIIDSSECTESSQVISILPAPSVPSGAKGPRERKLPPECRPSKQEKDDAELDELFSDLRVESDKNFLDIDEEQQVIRFESPLSGAFASEQIEWEAFPTTKAVTNDNEETTWGDDTEFKAEFEPLPHEIVTFEPFNPVNENLEWKLLIRQPEKKSKAKQISRYTSNRWWKEVYIRLSMEKDRPCLKFFENLEDTEPYRTVRIEPYMQLSRSKLQQYDKYGKLHIFKINHVVYKEMVGMRTEKFSLKTLQNLVSHKPKMNMVLDHMPLRTEIVKFGSLDKKPVRSLMSAIEDSMMSIKSHRDTSLEYTKEEVCCYVNDEYVCELSDEGSIITQKARTRIQFAAFVTGNPYIVLGVNDKWRFGNEIVRRQDIIPIMHDDWITIYEPEFHSSIDMVEYEKDHMIKFYPLDGCKFELMRFRIPLRPNKELPLLPDVKLKINGSRVDLRIDLSVPGFFSASKRHGAVHCDDIEIRVPIPEEWAYHFRVEKHTKYGSVHSALRKPGKIKGFERITQLAQSFLPASMLEASAGVAKYEHLFRAIVWRIPRLPEKNEASYKPHMMTCKFVLAPHDTVPSIEDMCKTFHVEFTMSASTVSGATVRSISVEHTSTPERFVKYLASFKYLRDIRYEFGDVKPPPITSILDQSYEVPDNGHSSDESHPEKSSFSEPGNSSPTRSQRNDSVDLLGANIDIDSKISATQSHSAMDDLLTLDCFSQPGVEPSVSVNNNTMEDIAMVDDDNQSE